MSQVGLLCAGNGCSAITPRTAPLATWKTSPHAAWTFTAPPTTAANHVAQALFGVRITAMARLLTARGMVPDTDAAGDELPAIDRIVLYVDDLDRCPRPGSSKSSKRSTSCWPVNCSSSWSPLTRSG